LGYSQTNQGLLKLNYDYGTSDNNGNVKSQQISFQGLAHLFNQTYTYDSLNRLKSAVENQNGTQNWKQTFIYDRYGNRRFDTNNGNTTTLATGCATAICNPEINAQNNRLIGTTFDSAGNTTADASGQTFVYDAENKQGQVSNASGIVGKYFYDGDGKRVKKEVPATGETTVFVYDASGKLVAEYSTIVEPTATAKVSYLTNDHLGSPRILTNQNGQVISRRDFLPFGEEIQSGTGGRNSAQGYGGQDSIRQKFTGYERDTETDLDFAQARMYSYSFGRFSSPDPIMMTKERLADPQAINLYVYTRNNPLIYIDPNGEEFKGTDGKKVEIEIKDGQIIIRSSNASIDLIRLVGLINKSGSATALKQFDRLNAHKTMINFAFGDKDPQGGAYGRHQPHGKRPDGTKGALTFNDVTNKFEGEAEIVKDSNGNEVYAEATITVYEGEYKDAYGSDEVVSNVVEMNS
jgi:RHS repeat-associated protein